MNTHPSITDQPGFDSLLGPITKQHYTLLEAGRVINLSRQSVQALVDEGELGAIQHNRIKGDGSRGKTTVLREHLQLYLSRKSTIDTITKREHLCEALRSFKRADLVFLRAEITRLIERQ